jgi:hypothetical protein
MMACTSSTRVTSNSDSSGTTMPRDASSCRAREQPSRQWRSRASYLKIQGGSAIAVGEQVPDLLVVDLEKRAAHAVLVLGRRLYRECQCGKPTPASGTTTTVALYLHASKNILDGESVQSFNKATFNVTHHRERLASTCHAIRKAGGIETGNGQKSIS